MLARPLQCCVSHRAHRAAPGVAPTLLGVVVHCQHVLKVPPGGRGGVQLRALQRPPRRRLRRQGVKQALQVCQVEAQGVVGQHPPCREGGVRAAVRRRACLSDKLGRRRLL